MNFLVLLALQSVFAQELPQFKNYIPGVKIIYSANINSEIEPCGCRTNPTGGIYRRYKIQQQLFGGEKLVLDSGDLFYKSMPIPPFLEKQWSYQAESLAKGMKILGLEVMTPGELDLALGVEQFQKLAGLANTKVVASNLYSKKTGKRIFEENLFLTKGGKKIAIFGIIDNTLTLPSDVQAKDPIEAADVEVKELRKKADVLIALTHLGLDNDKELASKVKGIDLIFGAHSQSFIITPEKIGDTLILQPSFRGQHLGVYADGTNQMYQVDGRFDDPNDKISPMAKLVEDTKKEVGKLNAAQDAEMIAEAQAPSYEYQTFVSCMECHAKQFNFHKVTPHFKAYETLVKAKQAGNLECLKCHTAGEQEQGGWKKLSELVQSKDGKSIPAEKFLIQAKDYKPVHFSKISKVHFNVQCENCHGAAGKHPFSGTYSKKVSKETCLQCHTSDRAPGWYVKGNQINPTVLDAKFKAMTCPK